MTRMRPNALLWVDAETPGLPEGNDYSKIPMLEIAGVVTDFDLNKHSVGYVGCAKLTREHALALKANPEVLEMHKVSGLLEDCAKSEDTVADLERGMIEMLESTGLKPGEFIISGSGVAAFDHPLIKEQMPELNKWLAYFPLDVGVLRRTIFHLGGGKKFVKPPAESFSNKSHRALDDILAHIEEAELYRDWLRELPDTV